MILNKFQNFELDILRFIREITNPFIDFLTEIITMLGEEYIMVLLLVIIYFIYDKTFGKKLAYIIFTSLAINNSLKGIVCRTRPFIVDPTLDSVRKQTATGYSFPSGHTQNSSTVYLGYAYNNNYKKKLIWSIAITLSILIGLSRLVLAVHYPTDVLAGLVLGTSCAIFLSILFNKVATNPKRELLLYALTFIIFLPFVFIFYQKDYASIYIYRNFYTTFSMFAGYIIGSFIETKYVDFNNNSLLKTKIFRLIGAIILYIIINFGLKFILPKENIFLDVFRYFMLTFCIIGIYPIILKNSLFKKGL